MPIADSSLTLCPTHSLSLWLGQLVGVCYTPSCLASAPRCALSCEPPHAMALHDRNTNKHSELALSLSLRCQRERESKSQLCVRVRVRVLEIIIIEPSSGIELKQCCRLVLHRKVTPERQQRKIVSIWRAPRLADTLEKVEIFTDQLENYLQTLLSILQFYHF